MGVFKNYNFELFLQKIKKIMKKNVKIEKYIRIYLYTYVTC